MARADFLAARGGCHLRNRGGDKNVLALRNAEANGNVPAMLGMLAAL